MEEKIIKCPICNTELMVTQEHLGLEVECPDCGQTFIVAGRDSEVYAVLPERNRFEKTNHPNDVIYKIISDLIFFKKLRKWSFFCMMLGLAGIWVINPGAGCFIFLVSGAIHLITAITSIVLTIKNDPGIKGIVDARTILKRHAIGSFVGNVISGSAFIVSYSCKPQYFDCFLWILLYFASFFIVSIIGLMILNIKMHKKTPKEDTPQQNMDPIRYHLNKFFSYDKDDGTIIGNIFEFVFNIVGICSLIRAVREAKRIKEAPFLVNNFPRLKGLDQGYLTTIDVLPNYGKTSSQLVAKSHTLFSPVLNDEVDDALYEFVDTEDQDILIYSLEQVTKIYTFEHQLFVFQAYWDYRTATLFNESTEAFFFEDITDISTQNEYKSIEVEIKKPSGEGKLSRIWDFISEKSQLFFFSIPSFIALVGNAIVLLDRGKIDITNAPFWVCVMSPLGAYFLIILIFFAFRTRTLYLSKKVRVSETLSINSTSGRRISMTILCNEYFEANNGKFDGRTDGEKLFHAIRKMIEEKKVSNNG